VVITARSRLLESLQGLRSRTTVLLGGGALRGDQKPHRGELTDP